MFEIYEGGVYHFSKLKLKLSACGKKVVHGFTRSCTFVPKVFIKYSTALLEILKDEM